MIDPGTKLILMSTEEPIYDPFKLLGENVTAFVNKFNLHDELYLLLEMHLSERKRKQS